MSNINRKTIEDVSHKDKTYGRSNPPNWFMSKYTIPYYLDSVLFSI